MEQYSNRKQNIESNFLETYDVLFQETLLKCLVIFIVKFILKDITLSKRMEFYDSFSRYY